MAIARRVQRNKARPHLQHEQKQLPHRRDCYRKKRASKRKQGLTCSRNTSSCPTAKRAMKELNVFMAMKAGTSRHMPAKHDSPQITQAACM
eukprot:scaffold96856_cov18-Tisochrysis_lutea.AAC.1